MVARKPKRSVAHTRPLTRQKPLNDSEDVPDLKSADLAPMRQCSAMSKRSGEQCKNYCGIGLRTCRMHGSATRRSKVAAAKRIAEASGYAADMLVEFMANPEVDEKARIQIAQDLLTRAGYNGRRELEVKISRFEEVEREIVMDIEPVELEAVVVEDAPRKALPAKTEDDIEEDILQRDRQRTAEYRRARGRRD